MRSLIFSLGLLKGDIGQCGPFSASWCANLAPPFLSCAAMAAGLIPSGKRCPGDTTGSLPRSSLPPQSTMVGVPGPQSSFPETVHDQGVTEYRAPNVFASISALVYLISESFINASLSLAESSSGISFCIMSLYMAEVLRRNRKWKLCTADVFETGRK